MGLLWGGKFVCRYLSLLNAYSKTRMSEQGWGKNVRTISRGGRRERGEWAVEPSDDLDFKRFITFPG